MMPNLIYSVIAAFLFGICSGGYISYEYTSGQYAKEKLELERTQKQREEQQRKVYDIQVAKGDKLSQELAVAQRQITNLRSQHESYAHRIVGTCPDSLRILLDASAAGVPVPEDSGLSPGSTGTIAASAIGESVAGNYSRCNEYIEQIKKIIKWSQGVPQ